MNKFVITSITIMSLIMGVMLTRIFVLESELKSVGVSPHFVHLITNWQ